jgi:hypothetical protein
VDTNHLEGQFNQIKWALSLIILVAGGVFVWFTGKSYADFQKIAEAHVNERLVDAEVLKRMREKVDARIVDQLASPQTKTNIDRLVQQQVMQRLDTEGGQRLNAAVEEATRRIRAVDFSKDILPRRVILPWFSNEAVPAGWAICDGTPPTPDLRDRFLKGAVDTNSVGAVGGSARHQHGIYKRRDARTGEGFQGEGDACMLGATDSAEHLPPFVSVIYIMKL